MTADCTTLGDINQEELEAQIENVDDTVPVGAQDETVVAKNDTQNAKIEPVGSPVPASDDDVMPNDECEHDGSAGNSENDTTQSTAGSVRNVKTRADKATTCGICGKGFHKPEYLNEHMNSHFGFNIFI